MSAWADELQTEYETWLENQDYGLGAAIEAASARNRAKAILAKYPHNNMIFLKHVPVGVLVDTSEGYCAEKLLSGEWLWPKEYPGEDGFYDLAEALTGEGYTVWRGVPRGGDAAESLAKFIHGL